MSNRFGVLDGFDVMTASVRERVVVTHPEWACPDDAAFVGIDPGQQGYIVGIPADGHAVLWGEPIPTFPTGNGGKLDYDLPHVWALVRSIPRGAFVMLERQQAYPKQGGVSNFNIGRGYMLWEMSLTAAGLPFETVHPRTWKGQMGIRAESAAGKTQTQRTKEAKARAVALAMRLFPGQDWKDKRKPNARTMCGDYCEAALLAVYGRRHAQ